MADKQYEELLLTPEKRRDIREKVYPFSEAIPIMDTEELVEKVQAETAKAQLAEVLKHRLDRPELREKIAKILTSWGIIPAIKPIISKELLALIPDIEEAVIQARKEQMVLDWAQAGKDIEEAKKQAELDGYAKGFAEGVNKGTVIGEKQERERIANEMMRRGKVGIDALPEDEQGFWKGYWQGLIDKGQALKGK